jgi:hypothetical protein
MSYESWRISFQSSEQAARAAYADMEKLRREMEKLKSMTAVTMGVGSGDGDLFVHGDYESIKVAQAIVLERDTLRAEVKRLRAGHPAAIHCDNCGCDWLDNGLNPIGCPYCKQPADAKILVAERDALEAENERLAEALRGMLDVAAESFANRTYVPINCPQAAKAYAVLSQEDRND